MEEQKKRRLQTTKLNDNDRKTLDNYARFYVSLVEKDSPKKETSEAERFSNR